jgi:hypothetical protein
MVEWIGPNAEKLPEQEIAAILPGHLAHAEVREITLALYMHEYSLPNEMLAVATLAEPALISIEFLDRLDGGCDVMVGDSPYLRAQKVQNVRVNTTGQLEWEKAIAAFVYPTEKRQ